MTPNARPYSGQSVLQPSLVPDCPLGLSLLAANHNPSSYGQYESQNAGATSRADALPPHHLRHNNDAPALALGLVSKLGFGAPC